MDDPLSTLPMRFWQSPEGSWQPISFSSFGIWSGFWGPSRLGPDAFTRRWRSLLDWLHRVRRDVADRPLDLRRSRLFL